MADGDLGYSPPCSSRAVQLNPVVCVVADLRATTPLLLDRVQAVGLNACLSYERILVGAEY